MPNVVLLTVDALRADHLSCYGYDRETSPTLDRIAEEGLRCSHAYSTSSHTREAVPSMLSGHYPGTAVDDSFRLGAETVATRLADRPHATAAFHSNPYASRTYGFDRDFDEFDDDLYLGNHRVLALAQRLWDKIRNHHYARAETINDRSLSWIDGLDDDPFFLWNHYMDVHGPYEPPEPHRGRFFDGGTSDRQAQRLYQRARKDGETVTDEEHYTLVDLYDGEVAYVDDQIGSFLDALEERGLLEDTLVLITSDHGDGLGEEGYYGHPRYLHEGLVRIPMLAFGSGVPMATVDAPVSLVDVVPSLLRAAGGSEDGLPGVPLQSLWTDGETGRDRVVFAEARGLGDDDDLRRYRAQGTEDHLLYERVDREPLGPEELTGGGLESALRSHIQRERETDTLGIDVDEETDAVKDRLEALGYRE